MSEQNKALARRFFLEAFTQGRIELVDELVAPNAVFYNASVPGGKIIGPEGIRAVVQRYRTAFPKLQFAIDDQIAEGDKVVTRWTWTVTHEGPLMGIAPTGKTATLPGIDIDRYQNGKVVEGWASYDMLDMLRQLGVGPDGRPWS